MTAGPRSLHSLSGTEWQLLDRQLEGLLDLDAERRQARLRDIASCQPTLAAQLRQLLQDDDGERRLDDRLRSALSHFAGQQSVSPGTRVGAWRILRSIGHGGMAEVCLAERADGAFERQVALKLLWPGLVHERASELVRQERDLLARLDDSRIAQLLDGGVTDSGQPWLAMEFIDGVPLNAYCQRQQLPLAARLTLFIDVIEAVHSAHRQWIAHGDIKPANVLVTAAGKVKLLDFGIARLWDESRDEGASTARWRAWTPNWASPEQARGDAPTPASDLYQLGLLMQELIDQQLPRGGRRRHELLAIIDTARHEDPQQRYSSAAIMAEDIRAWLAQRPLRMLAGQRGYRLRCLLRRRWPLIGALGGLLLLGVVLGQQQWRHSRVLAERHATNAAVLGFLQDLLERGNPRLSHDEALLSSSLLTEAAAGLEQQLGDQPAAMVAILNTLGRIHRTRNELLPARQRYQRALELARQEGLLDAQDVALDGLATVGIWSGDYAQSEALLRELIQNRQQNARGRREIASARLQLADLLHSRGDYGAALALARQVYDSGLHPAWSARVLGMVQRDLGEFDAAQATLLPSLQGHGDAVQQIELSYHLAILRLHQGQLDAAWLALDSAARQREQLVGKHWQGLLWSRQWSALHALAGGRLQEAATQLDLALADYERFLGSGSHLLAYARSDRGYVALAMGDIELAQRQFQQALERLQSLRAGDHPRAAEALLGLALVAMAQGHEEQGRMQAAGAEHIRRQLPANGAGTRRWRANACEVLQISGGRCGGPANTADGPDSAVGLDTLRLQRALAGLCSRPAGGGALPCIRLRRPGQPGLLDS